VRGLAQSYRVLDRHPAAGAARSRCGGAAARRDRAGLCGRPQRIAALPGQATRARCADLAVVLLRLQAQRAWLLVERPVADYLLDWLRLACERVGAG